MAKVEHPCEHEIRRRGVVRSWATCNRIAVCWEDHEHAKGGRLRLFFCRRHKETTRPRVQGMRVVRRGDL